MTNLEIAIDNLFWKWGNETPGCSIGILHNSKLIFQKGYGCANLDYNIVNNPKTVFRVASLSKQFTAYCIALMESKNQIKFEDPVNKYLDNFPKFKTPIKIKHLILHSSGLRDLYELSLLKDWDFRRIDQLNYDTFYKLIQDQKTLNFSPGSKFSYSNTGYILLSMIIKKITGKSLGEYAKTNIFQPLGMNNTLFREDSSQIIKNRATGYVQKTNNTFSEFSSSLEISGDGLLFTNIIDFAKWENNFYNPSSNMKHIIQKVSKPYFTSISTPFDYTTKGYGYGLFFNNYNSIEAISHSGSWAGFNSFMLRFPKMKYSLFLFSNLAGFNPGYYAYQIANRLLNFERPNKFDVYNYKQELIPNKKPLNLEYKKYLGYFINRELDLIIEIVKKGDCLSCPIIDIEELIHLENNIFQPKYSRTPMFVKFDKNQTSNSYNSLIIQNPPPSAEIKFCRFNPPELTAYQMKTIVGNYFSEELKSYYQIIKKGKFLELRYPNQTQNRLIPYKKNKFYLFNGFQVKIDRKDAKVLGFWFKHEDMNGIYCKKI